jgi:hypothetical protein
MSQLDAFHHRAQVAAFGCAGITLISIHLTLEQQNVTTVQGIIPTLLTLIDTVNLDC